MKKYLLGLLAVVVGLGLTAFTNVKHKKPYTMYTFVFTGSPTVRTDFTRTDAAHTTYTRWVYFGNMPLCSAPAHERGCSITVSEIFTHIDEDDNIQLNASDPDGVLYPKIAFPMLVEAGLFTTIQYYVLNDLIQIPGVLLINNTTVQ